MTAERQDIVPNRNRYIIAFTALAIAAAFLLPAMPQPLDYHDFADDRTMFGIVNFLNVVSNIGFLLAGIAGLAVVLQPRTQFESGSERLPYAIFFLGMMLTAAGSSYYHLAPDNETLFWDRLPMTIAFMSLISAQVVDRINVRAGLALLAPLLLVGAATVFYWRATERAGVGNVLPYAILQGYSVVMLLLFALFQPSRYTRGNDIYWVFAWYVIAKLLEHVRCRGSGDGKPRQRPHPQASGCCNGWTRGLSNVDVADPERAAEPTGSGSRRKERGARVRAAPSGHCRYGCCVAHSGPQCCQTHAGCQRSIHCNFLLHAAIRSVALRSDCSAELSAAWRRASSSFDKEVFRIRPPVPCTSASTLSAVTFRTSTKSAELPGFRAPASSFINLSLIPMSLNAPPTTPARRPRNREAHEQQADQGTPKASAQRSGRGQVMDLVQLNLAVRLSDRHDGIPRSTR